MFLYVCVCGMMKNNMMRVDERVRAQSNSHQELNSSHGYKKHFSIFNSLFYTFFHFSKNFATIFLVFIMGHSLRRLFFLLLAP